MAGLAAVALLAAVAVGSVRGSAALAAARWPYRSPAAAIVLWQALGLAGGLAAIGALLGLGVPPHSASIADGLVSAASGIAGGHVIRSGQAILPAMLRLFSLLTGLALLGMLCWVLIAASVAVVRARRRHRVLLALLAHGDPKAPGALVVDHPAAAAYCLPGLRSQIVVSVGTLDLLRPAELAAVLEHERAHLRERHDLVLLPFTALRRAFGWSRICAQAQQSVALLIEMLADDHALRVLSPRALAAALARFGTAGSECAPAGSLGMSRPASGGDLTARVNRLLDPAPGLPLPVITVICCGAALLATIPVALLALPA